MEKTLEEKLREIANLATYAAPVEYVNVKDGKQKRKKQEVISLMYQ